MSVFFKVNNELPVPKVTLEIDNYNSLDKMNLKTVLKINPHTFRFDSIEEGMKRGIECNFYFQCMLCNEEIEGEIQIYDQAVTISFSCFSISLSISMFDIENVKNMHERFKKKPLHILNGWGVEKIFLS